MPARRTRGTAPVTACCRCSPSATPQLDDAPGRAAAACARPSRSSRRSATRASPRPLWCADPRRRRRRRRRTRTATGAGAASGASAGSPPWNTRTAGAAWSTCPADARTTPRARAGSAPVLAGRRRRGPGRGARRRACSARRLVARPLGGGTPARRLAPRGTVLVTGGTGALGAHVARWLAAERRRAPAAHQPPRRRRAGRRRTRGRADGAAARGHRRRLRRRRPGRPRRAARHACPATRPLTAVVHAAGVLDDGVHRPRSRPSRLADVLRAKADAAPQPARADRATWTSTRSSCSPRSPARWGSGRPGQLRRRQRLPRRARRAAPRRGPAATVVAWGPWAGGGMAARPATAGRLLRRSGIGARWPRTRRSPRSQQALGTTARPRSPSPTSTGPASPRPFTAAGSAALLRDPTAAPQAARRRPPASDDAGRRGRAAGRPARRPSGEQATLLDLVRAQAAAVLGSPARDGGRARTGAFRDLGFDSLTAVELRNRLSAATGLRLPATLVFDHPTAAALAALPARRAARRPTAGRAAGPRRPAAPRGRRPDRHRRMSCRFPGGVSTPEDLWRAARRRRRRHLRRSPPTAAGTSTALRPGPGHAGHDATPAAAASSTTPPSSTPTFFGISPREALAMDPQQRLLLETVVGGVRARRHRPAVAARQPHRRVRRRQRPGLRRPPRTDAPDGVEGYLGTGNAASVVSGRVVVRLRPRRARASPSTRPARRRWSPCTWRRRRCAQGECDLALAGGVTVMSTPGAFVEFSRQRGLAADGRCKAFAAAADGTGWGEGVGVLLLERLSDAAPQRPPGPRRRARLRGQPGRRVQRPDRPQRPVPAAGHPPGARQRRPDAPPTSTRSRRTAPAPRWATRSRRRRCSRPTARTGRRPAAVARLGEVQHRPHPGGRRVAGVIKMVMAMRHGVAAADPARRRAVARTSTGRRARSSCSTEARAVARAADRAAPGGCLVVRHQRHQRPRDPGAGSRWTGPPPRRADTDVPSGRAVPGWCRAGARRRCARRPAAARRTSTAREPLDCVDVGWSLARAGRCSSTGLWSGPGIGTSSCPGWRLWPPVVVRGGVGVGGRGPAGCGLHGSGQPAAGYGP